MDGVIVAAPDPGQRRARSRLFAALSGVWGLLLLLRAGPLVAAVCPEFPESEQWVVRVLGGRLVVQQALVLSRPTHRRVRAAATVDMLHAASMVPLLWSPRYRRAALVSGGSAALFSALFAAVTPRS
jgi:hypothetical protein